VDLRYDGHVALITGGSRGIGLAVARTLLSEGCRVVISGRNQATVDAALETLASDSAAGFASDLSVDDSPARLVEQSVSAFGRLDVVVNNAATFGEGHFMSSPLDDWEAILRLKLLGYLGVVRAAMPHLCASGGGSVINIAGVAGMKPLSGSGHAGAANAAVIQLSQLMALEFAGDAVRVNTISPGSVTTDRMATRVEALMAEWGEDRSTVEAKLAARVPRGELVTAEEVATVVAMLCSPRLRTTLGNNIVIDGGFVLR
jgi:NAD(P)-dependent dehydrogenase (short-subunit alcohol dehydrogenase family)